MKVWQTVNIQQQFKTYLFPILYHYQHTQLKHLWTLTGIQQTYTWKLLCVLCNGVTQWSSNIMADGDSESVKWSYYHFQQMSFKWRDRSQGLHLKVPTSTIDQHAFSWSSFQSKPQSPCQNLHSTLQAQQLTEKLSQLHQRHICRQWENSIKK